MLPRVAYFLSTQFRWLETWFTWQIIPHSSFHHITRGKDVCFTRNNSVRINETQIAWLLFVVFQRRGLEGLILIAQTAHTEQTGHKTKVIWGHLVKLTVVHLPLKYYVTVKTTGMAFQALITQCINISHKRIKQGREKKGQGYPTVCNVEPLWKRKPGNRKGPTLCLQWNQVTFGKIMSLQCCFWTHRHQGIYMQCLLLHVKLFSNG